MVPICFQAPTWTFMRLQPPEHQLCFIKASTLDLGAPTPKTPILPVVRHQPQGLQPYVVKAPTLDIGGPTPRTPILPTSEAPIPRAPTLCYQGMFDSNFLLPKLFLLNYVCLQLHYSLNAIASMETSLHMKKYLQLFILSTQSLQKLSHDDIK